MSHLRVKHLPGKASGLLQNDAAILCVSVIPETGSLVEETLAVRVEHDAEWIAVTVSGMRLVQIADIGGISLPHYRVTSRPLAIGLGAHINRTFNPLASIDSRPATLPQFPQQAPR